MKVLGYRGKEIVQLFESSIDHSVMNVSYSGTMQDGQQRMAEKWFLWVSLHLRDQKIKFSSIVLSNGT